MMFRTVILTITTVALSLPLSAAAVQETAVQDADLSLRIQRLESKNEQLEAMLLALAGDVEHFEMRDVMPGVGEGEWGLGPAASKVYGVQQGFSIGGYGEFLFSAPAGGTDTADAQRVVTYIGYKFNDNWVFNSEIEFEHATTSSGSASAEFAYLDYLHDDEFNVRGGLVLVPLGFVNELHEPTTFLAAARPVTEQLIIPTTWRENGIGAFGNVSGFDYRVYVVSGMNGSEFTASGFRGGRQKGSRAATNDAALAARVDWVDTPGLLVGGSAYHGQADQDLGGLPDMATTIIDVHVDWKVGPWSLRVLTTQSHVSNAGAFNLITANNLAEDMNGTYVEAGYDILTNIAPRSEQSLTPFLRWETIDTQASLPSGFSASGGVDDEILTFGLNYKPIDQIVIKADYQDWDDGTDRLQLLIGYVF
ncbi:MAG: hypothetical protein ACI8QZ_003660 [Chlamydiales bacterium]|jgi:hypothetical protein